MLSGLRRFSRRTFTRDGVAGEVTDVVVVAGVTAAAAGGAFAGKRLEFSAEPLAKMNQIPKANITSKTT
jgi:hypothetical protein